VKLLYKRLKIFTARKDITIVKIKNKITSDKTVFKKLFFLKRIPPKKNIE